MTESVESVESVDWETKPLTGRPESSGLAGEAGDVARAANKEPMPPGKVLWRALSIFDDAFTVVISVADIVTDVLVLLEFRELGYNACFGLSLAIFALAQVSYAFLFTASYASHHSPLLRMAVFVAVLPVAQLVPVFGWLESMQLSVVDSGLRRLGLKPTSDQKAGTSSDAGADSLWGFLQSKYQSHAGFLVEAFVEAVPQAILQTVFVVATGQGNALNAISVAISVFTIASKGYLVSYALDNLTFVFNFLCIVADCVGMFACATLLAMDGLGGAFARSIIFLSAAGLLLSVVSGHGLLWFTILDDHLKLRLKEQWPDGVRGVANIGFDLYLVRVLAWWLAIVPCVVLFAGARLSLIPVLVFKSVNPDLVRYARFFRGLMRFLHGKGGGAKGIEARLWTVNTFLAQARESVDLLERLPNGGTPATRAAAMRRWAERVGAPWPERTLLGFTHSRRYLETVGQEEADEDDAVQRAILESLSAARGNADDDADLAARLRAQIRQLQATAWIRRNVRTFSSMLQSRSEVFRGGCNASLLHTELREQPLGVVLRVLAVIGLAIFMVGAVPLAMGHAALMVASVVFPLTRVGPTCAAWSDASALPCSLGAGYCVIVLLVLALAPWVARRHSVWLELADLHGFPERFYGGAVLVEIRRRHLRDSILRKRLGHYLMQHTLGFLEA